MNFAIQLDFGPKWSRKFVSTPQHHLECPRPAPTTFRDMVASFRTREEAILAAAKFCQEYPGVIHRRVVPLTVVDFNLAVDPRYDVEIPWVGREGVCLDCGSADIMALTGAVVPHTTPFHCNDCDHTWDAQQPIERQVPRVTDEASVRAYLGGGREWDIARLHSSKTEPFMFGWAARSQELPWVLFVRGEPFPAKTWT